MTYSTFRRHTFYKLYKIGCFIIFGKPCLAYFSQAKNFIKGCKLAIAVNKSDDKFLSIKTKKQREEKEKLKTD